MLLFFFLLQVLHLVFFSSLSLLLSLLACMQLIARQGHRDAGGFVHFFFLLLSSFLFRVVQTYKWFWNRSLFLLFYFSKKKKELYHYYFCASTLCTFMLDGEGCREVSGRGRKRWSKMYGRYERGKRVMSRLPYDWRDLSILSCEANNAHPPLLWVFFFFLSSSSFSVTRPFFSTADLCQWVVSFFRSFAFVPSPRPLYGCHLVFFFFLSRV